MQMQAPTTETISVAIVLFALNPIRLKTQPPTKAGQGISSSADSGVEELCKSAMTQKAVKHVKRTIEDFLMGE